MTKYADCATGPCKYRLHLACGIILLTAGATFAAIAFSLAASYGHVPPLLMIALIFALAYGLDAPRKGLQRRRASRR